MELEALTIRDAKGDASMNPMFFQSIAQGIRSFEDACNDGNSDFGKHPEDYALFKVGTFNQRTGVLSALDTPLHVANGADLVGYPDPGIHDKPERGITVE